MKKILVANRGEIALNAIRCIREMGLASVAVYSDVDASAMHIRYADEVQALPGGRASLNYASVERVLDAAQRAGADAIYPGYGFLSESKELAGACRDRGITFIGPGPEAMERCQDKVSGLNAARSLGIATPEYREAVTGEEDLVEKAQRIGYPVLLKPVSGSGGRFLYKAYQREELVEAFRSMLQEQSIKSLNIPFYLEAYIRHAVHVEYPILADQTGQVIHLGDRECTVQRRYQKLVSETPSRNLPEPARREMAEAAVTIARHTGFQGCGAVEFMVDENGRWYFMEINPRIPVEYTLTETSYGVELIKEQIRIASGLPLSPSLHDLHPRFHSIECRISAEDPAGEFRPSAGVIHEYYLPGGFGYSVLSSIQKGQRVEIYYDPMILKINCFAATRDEMLAKLLFALDAIRVKGVKTNIPFIRRIIDSPQFRDGTLKCDFKLKDFLPAHAGDKKRQEVAAIVAALDLEAIGMFRMPAFKPDAGASQANAWSMSGRMELLQKRNL